MYLRGSLQVWGHFEEAEQKLYIFGKRSQQLSLTEYGKSLTRLTRIAALL